MAGAAKLTNTERQGLLQQSLKELLLKNTLMNTAEVAAALNVSERTIIRWRCDKVNLEYSMIGGQARYDPVAVQAYMKSREIQVAASHSIPIQAATPESPTNRAFLNTENVGGILKE